MTNTARLNCLLSYEPGRVHINRIGTDVRCTAGITGLFQAVKRRLSFLCMCIAILKY